MRLKIRLKNCKTLCLNQSLRKYIQAQKQTDLALSGSFTTSTRAGQRPQVGPRTEGKGREGSRRPGLSGGQGAPPPRGLGRARGQHILRAASLAQARHTPRAWPSCLPPGTRHMKAGRGSMNRVPSGLPPALLGKAALRFQPRHKQSLK